jgi:dTDP-glucose 4,6-dehydratase
VHYLVTGGCGFIGSNYVRGLLLGRWGQEVSQVSVVDKLTYAGNLENLREVDEDPRLHFYKDDILDLPRMAELLQGVDVVVHFAAESHVDRSIEGSSEFIQTNVAGTHSMLQASVENKVKIFLHVSTDEV